MSMCPGAGAPTALLTDMYEYTMLDAALQDGTADRRCVFEVYTRHLPLGRRYGVAAGAGRLMESIDAFHPSEDDLRFLSDRHIVSPPTLRWLEDYRFSGSIRGYREGETFFPDSPILQVEGTFAQCTLLETLILSTLNYDSAVASAASRMVSVAEGRPCMDMGARRANEWAAVSAARSAIVGGFQGTSNLQAAKLYDLPAIGTAAHCFTLLHDSERDAFASQIQALGKGTTLLTDTYSVREAVQTAVELAGPDLGGVRLDSGDLASLAQQVRALLDSLGARKATITVTNDLDEYAIAALKTAPVDSYGVGTQLVTGSGAPTCAMVYKLVEREGADGSMVPVAKRSVGKASMPGRKLAFRALEDGRAVSEQVVAGGEEALDAFQPPEGWRNLLDTYMEDGETNPDFVGREALLRARDRRAASLAELPIAAMSLMKDEPVIPTLTQSLG
ncbi:nicotinate phosphoribosyltransferase [Bifidobacterium actinocoloniiforme DSM 22766]|nr:nicotinate phosphoribosyltransferase [Bifidobacterium actinocoloniiforme]AKV55985.1 nicotinate phosphoribosyltransferase [Bifidobacterium actinocoloniiforme DSM 22766]